MKVLGLAVLTMAAAQLLDLATFNLMVNRLGIEAEQNPLIISIFEAHGFPLVAIVKVALLALVTAIVAVLARAPTPTSRLAAALIVAILATGICAGLVGGATNTAAIGLL